MKSIIYLISIFLIISCGAIRPVNTPVRPQKEVLKTKSIRPKKKKTTNPLVVKYRRLRKRNWKRYLKKSKPKRFILKRRIRKKAVIKTRLKLRQKPNIKVFKLSVKKKTPIKKPYMESKKEVIITKQILTYYCMKNRKSSKFKSKGSCKLFTQNIYQTCRKITQSQKGQSIIRCINKYLKKK